MIKKKTVFVLGAGASAPYGFPLGDELSDLVRQKLLGQPPALNEFAANVRDAGGFSRFDVDLFAQHLGAAGRYSIDEFLVEHQQYKAIGKIAIARLLMPYETDAALDPHAPLDPDPEKPDRRWYRYCFDKLLTSASGPCSLASNNLSVITFNFDRSFECALYKFVVANCLPDGDPRNPKMANLMGTIPVYHVHGRLGSPDWFDDSDWTTPDDPRAYEVHVDAKSLKHCADAIRIFDDDIEGLTLENARGALAEAETVCFLGFSYHPMNLAKLCLETFSRAQLFGTFFRMDGGQQRSTVRVFNAISRTGLGSTANDQDILDLLKSVDVLYE